jgi:hypothetical protein
MKLKWLFSIITVLLLVVGCSDNDKNKDGSDTANGTNNQVVDDKGNANENDNAVEGENTPSQSEQSIDNSENTELQIEQNKELTKQVKQEKGVIDGQVYEQDGMAIGTLLLEKKVSDKDAKRLAEKYADELKKEYKDLVINVQAVRDGENVANITKE